MTTMERRFDPRLTGAAWLVARVWVGWQFLQGGREKITGQERAVWVGDHAGVAVGGFLSHALDLAPGGAMAAPHPEVSGWYAALIRHALLPHAVAFSYLVTAGELLVGIALILGLTTRFAATMGLMMNLAYLFAGTSGPGPIMVLIELPILLTGVTAGFYGVDRILMPILREHLVRPTWALARRPSSTPTLQIG
jgi:thiosulfate dehydrogenase [quinone] large subunit